MGQRVDINPATLGPALHGQLGELNALRTLQEVMVPGSVRDHMANEVLPLQTETVGKYLSVRHRIPLLDELHGLRLVRIPYWAGRIDSVLSHAACQSRYRGAVSAIDMKC